MTPQRSPRRFATLLGLLAILAATGAWGQEPDAPAPGLTPGPAGQASEESTPTPTPTEELTEEEAAAADKAFSEKWREFLKAAQGLLVWDFFDGNLTVRSHARIKVDATGAQGDETFESVYGEPDGSLKLRELSLYAQGTIDRRMRYSLGFDFGTDIGLADAFVEGREEGLRLFGYRIGQFRVGHFQEPFSFERLMSSHYTGFLERASPVWTFTPGFNLGYMLHDRAHNDRMQWAVGFFTFGQHNEKNASASVLSITARASGLPLYRDEGRRLLHLGASFSARDPSGDSVQYRSRPEARFVDFVVDTGDLEAGKIRLYGAEAVAVAGPLHLQSELVLSQVENTEYGDLDLWGCYVQVGWFLTGEHRVYDRATGVFGRMAPKTDYTGGVMGVVTGQGGGGLEITGRISKLDLDDGGLRGGVMSNLTLGLNWHLSATSTVKLNYVRSSVEDKGRSNIFTLRYQYRPLPLPGWR